MANPLKKTMVYLGLADDEIEYRDDAVLASSETVPQEPHRAPERHTAERQSEPREAHITHLRPVAKPAPAQNASSMNEILTVHPKAYKDAQAIAEHFRDGVPVIINLSEMNDADARRLIDFASGLSIGLYGKIERVTNKVFLLSPANIAVAGVDAGSDAQEQQSFFQ